MWVECIIIMPATIAIVALTFSIYALKPFFPECSPPDEAVKLLAVLCITILAFVNCWDVKWATTIQAQNLPFSPTLTSYQDVFTYAKLFALFVIIVTGVVQLYRGKVKIKEKE